MAQESIKNLKQRIKKAEELKQQRRDLNEGAYEIAMPQRNLYSGTTVGDSRMHGVFTSSGISSVNNFVNNMQNSLTPAFTRWAQLEAGEDVGEDQETELNTTLKELTDKIFTFIDNSNFNTASAEMYYDLAVGTGALLVNRGEFDKPLNFQAVPTMQLALEEGPFGTIGGVFRKHKTPARLIEHQWKDAKFSDEFAKKVKDKPNEDIELEEVTYQDMASGKWYYEVLYMGTGKTSDGAVRIVSRVMDYNPWIIVRWSKIAGEVEGRGPLLQALPDLKMLNHGKEMAAVSVQMNAFGSYTVEEDGIIDPRSAKISPSGFLVVKKNAGGGGSPSIAPLPRVGDTAEQQFFFDGLQDDIKKIMLDNKLPSEAGPVRSPTEIVERIKEFQVDFGSAFGRLMYEFIAPLFKTIIIVLEEAGKITVPVVEVDNPITGRREQKKITDEVAFTKIKMLAPVAKAQALEDVQNLMQAVQMIASIDPRLVPIGYKVEELPKYIGDKLGMPADKIRTQAEMQKKTEEIAGLLQQEGLQGGV